MRPKHKDYPLHTSNKDTAKMLFQKRRAEYLHGTFDPWNDKRVDGYTIDEALEEYLERQDMRESTRRCKRFRLGPFVRNYPGMMVWGITQEIVRAYCYRKSLNTITQHRYLYEFRHFLEYCQSAGWIATNPAAQVLKDTPRRKRR